MATTTVRQFYEGLLAELVKAVGDLIPESSVYLIAVPALDPMNNIALQLIPGSPVNTGPRSGSPLIETEFDVVIWLQSFDDVGHVDTKKLIDNTWSAFVIQDRVHEAMIGSDADSRATIQVQYIRSSRPSVNREMYGWVSLTSTYRASYQLEYR